MASKSDKRNENVGSGKAERGREWDAARSENDTLEAGVRLETEQRVKDWMHDRELDAPRH